MDGDVETKLGESPNGMPVERLGHTGLKVRCRAHFERNPLVPHEGREASEPGPIPPEVVDVLADPHTVADALGTAELNSLPH